MNHFSLAYFLGALCFFLYGLHLTEDGLRSALGDRLRTIIDQATQNRITAFLLGILMTAIFQSSTATTVMLVGLSSLGLLSLRKAIPVVLGADVGTTLLVLLLATFVRIDILSVSLSVLIVGFVTTFVCRNHPFKHYAQAILGFGFIFYGLGLISSANQVLRESELIRALIEAIAGRPPLAMFFAVLITGMLQSSMAVIGMLLSFAAVGLLTVTEAVPFVLGANLGSTIGPLFASAQAQADGKRVAYIHASIKVIGVILFLPFFHALASLATQVTVSASYQVALVHILFNVALALVFLPLTPFISKLAYRFIRIQEKEKGFRAKYLDPHSLDSPTLAFANVHREILRMAEITQEMCSKALIPFSETSRDTMEYLEELDDRVDYLNREIKFYMAKLNQAELTDSQGRRQQELVMLTQNIESIGDVVIKDLVKLAEKKRRKNVSFSDEGWKDIQEFHRMVIENFGLSVTALAASDLDLGKKVIRHKKYLGEFEEDLAQRHLLRLHQGLKESFDTSSIHLDTLSNLRRINSVISKLAYPVLDRREAKST